MNATKKAGEKSIRVPSSELNLSTFGFLFSSIISYHASKKRNVEKELIAMGESVGVRLIELIYLRNNKLKKETKPVDIL